VAYSVTWAESAITSVAEEAEYIAKDSPSYAATLIEKAEQAANSLFQFFPNRGRVVPEYGDETIRELFVDRYRLIYRVRDSGVLIAAFLHGARDLSAMALTIEQ
jgi:plasmid stabilization system protein ParE